MKPCHIFCIFCPDLDKFQQEFFKKIIYVFLYVSEIHVAQRSETRSVVRGVNEFVVYAPTI